MRKKAFVLLSGGMDSTTCLFKARTEYPEVEALSINYGQRHLKETEYAAATCEQLQISHTVLDIGKVLAGANVMLTRESVGNIEVPDISYDEIKGVSPTYVPFRNGTMLSVIAAHGQKYVNEQIQISVDDMLKHGAVEASEAHKIATLEAKDLVGIYFGAHAEDAQNWAYPDCTPEFIGAMANAIYIGTYFTIRLHTPIMWLRKHEIVTMGANLGVPWKNTWSCYKGEDLHCGVCPTCRSRKAAFFMAGIDDPTEYQNPGMKGVDDSANPGPSA